MDTTTRAAVDAVDRGRFGGGGGAGGFDEEEGTPASRTTSSMQYARNGNTPLACIDVVIAEPSATRGRRCHEHLQLFNGDATAAGIAAGTAILPIPSERQLAEPQEQQHDQHRQHEEKGTHGQ